MKINKIIFFALKLAVSTLLLYIVFSKMDISQVMPTMKKIGPLYFLAAIFIYILSQLISTMRWKLLLPDKFTVRRLFSLYMIGAFFSSFMPGVIGGDVVKAYYLNKDSRKLSLTLASIFMDRYLGYVSLMIIGMAAFPFSLRFIGEAVNINLYIFDVPVRWVFPAIFVAFIIGSFLFFGLQLGKRFRVVSEFYEYFVLLKAQKAVIIKAITLSVLLQLMGFAAVGFLASAMGEDIPLLLLCVFLPIIVTIASLPISIAGFGLREYSFVVLLGFIGIKPETALSLSFAWVLSILVGSLPGLVAYIRRSARAAAQ